MNYIYSLAIIALVACGQKSTQSATQDSPVNQNGSGHNPSQTPPDEGVKSETGGDHDIPGAIAVIEDGTSSSVSRAIKCYRQSNAQFVGWALAGCFSILFGDEIQVEFDHNGRSNPSIFSQINVTESQVAAYPVGNYNNLILYCSYKSTDCTGDCYLTIGENMERYWGGVGSRVRYSLPSLPARIGIHSSGKWLRTTGNEIPQIGVELLSHVDHRQQCKTVTWTASSAILLNTVWTPPVPLPQPLGFLRPRFD